MFTAAGPRTAAVAAALLFAAGVHPASAAVSVSPFVKAGFEHDSNVFMRPSPASIGLGTLADTIQDYQAGVGAQFDWGPDRLSLDAQGTRDIYHRFTFLDHYEYRLIGDLDWRFGTALETRLRFRQRRYMAPFTDTLAVGLFLDTDRTASALMRIQLAPKWRLDLTPELRQRDTPLPGFPRFKRRDTLATAEVDYLGFGRLTAGLRFEYIHGRYAHIVRATRYDQRKVDLTANYKLSGFSTFGASVGYTRRGTVPNPADSVPTPAGKPGSFVNYGGALGTTSGVNGALSYTRQLTGKTSVSLSIFRRVQSYAAAALPEIATGGTAGVTWKPDVKFTVGLHYSLTREQIKGALAVVNFANRTNRTQAAQLTIEYAALSWLMIRPYVTWDHATSTFRLGNYSATIVGVDVTSRFTW